jgi:ArsR family transcriptional regulator
MRSLDNKIALLRVIAHPVRIKILDELTKGVKCVGDFEKFLDIRQPNVSQHLTLLRTHGVVDYYVDGKLRCYFLIDPMIPEILALLNEDFKEPLPPPSCCPAKGRRAGA